MNNSDIIIAHPSGDKSEALKTFSKILLIPLLQKED